MSYKICTIRGIPIRIDYLLIGIVAILTLGSLPRGGGAFITTLLFNLGLLVSIVLHELGHSLVAIRKGCRVRRIVLTVIGGMAQLEEMPRKPWDEFLMAIMGPLVSIGIGLVCWFGGALIPASVWPRGALFPTLPFKGNIIQLLGFYNFVLAGFNLLPAFPMDGGRVFRALLTPKYGRLRATFLAARLGRVVAVCLAILAFYPPFSLTLLLIAAFVFVFAGNEYRQVRNEVQNEERPDPITSFFNSPFFRPPPPPTPPPSPHDSETDDTDLVSISPPPYRKGPNAKSPVHHETPDDGFFRL